MIEAWLLIAASLLVLSGVAKVIDPAPTSGALAAARLPAGDAIVRLVGVTEVAVALVGVVVGGPALVGMAVVYGSFAWFIAIALHRDLPIRSCGCFGRADTPPTVGHLLFNALSMGAALGGALGGTVPVAVLRDQPLAGVPYLGFVAIGVWVVYLLLAELPQVGARRR